PTKNKYPYLKGAGMNPNAFLLNTLRPNPNLSLIPCQQLIQHKRQHTTRENNNRHRYSRMIAGNSDEWRDKHGGETSMVERQAHRRKKAGSQEMLRRFLPLSPAAACQAKRK